MGFASFGFVLEVVPLLENAEVFNGIAETLEWASAIEGFVEVRLLLLVASVGKGFHNAEGLSTGNGFYLDEFVMEVGTDLFLLPIVIGGDFVFCDFVFFEHVIALNEGDFACGEINEMGSTIFG